MTFQGAHYCPKLCLMKDLNNNHIAFKVFFFRNSQLQTFKNGHTDIFPVKFDKYYYSV